LLRTILHKLQIPGEREIYEEMHFLLGYMPMNRGETTLCSLGLGRKTMGGMATEEEEPRVELALSMAV
jgi:hypothetical protein